MLVDCVSFNISFIRILILIKHIAIQFLEELNINFREQQVMHIYIVVYKPLYNFQSGLILPDVQL